MKENVLTLYKTTGNAKRLQGFTNFFPCVILNWGDNMELIAGAALAVLILLMAGLDIWYIFMGFVALVTMGAFATMVMFSVCAAMLAGSARKKARFTRFDDSGRFDSAVYEIYGMEYRNMFPAEFVMRDRLYRSDRKVSVRLTRKRRVFDRNALITVAVGLPLSAVITALFGFALVFMAGLR